MAWNELPLLPGGWAQIQQIANTLLDGKYAHLVPWTNQIAAEALAEAQGDTQRALVLVHQQQQADPDPVRHAQWQEFLGAVVEMNERMDEVLYPQDDEDEEDDPGQNAP